MRIRPTWRVSVKLDVRCVRCLTAHSPSTRGCTTTYPRVLPLSAVEHTSKPCTFSSCGIYFPFPLSLRSARATANTHLTAPSQLSPACPNILALAAEPAHQRRRDKSEATENVPRPIRRQGMPFRKTERLGGEMEGEGRRRKNHRRFREICRHTHKGETTTQRQKQRKRDESHIKKKRPAHRHTHRHTHTHAQTHVHRSEKVIIIRERRDSFDICPSSPLSTSSSSTRTHTPNIQSNATWERGPDIQHKKKRNIHAHTSPARTDTKTQIPAGICTHRHIRTRSDRGKREHAQVPRADAGTHQEREKNGRTKKRR